MQDAIILEGVSKRFPRYSAHKPTTFQEAVLKGLRGMRKAEMVPVLQDVSFRIAPGRMVGLIGRNGSGKSTLLRLIGRIGLPDKGNVTVNGRIRALLDLGVGLHPDLTGRENVFVSGVIAGLTRRQIEQQFDDIVSFAELELFIENPLRTYSTGMRMRLGFSIAVHTSPEVLLLDEVLAVGDMTFQRKCLDRIAQFRAGGCTIVFVSHDETQIQQLCDEVVYLREGKLVAWGDPKVVVGQYITDMKRENYKRTPGGFPSLKSSAGVELTARKNRFGSLEMQITSVRLLDIEGKPIQELCSGESLQVEIEYMAPHLVPSPAFGVTITREDDLLCYDTTTAASGQLLPALEGQGKITLEIERLDLNGGQYYVNVGVYEPNENYAYDYHWQVYSLTIRQPNFYDKGVLSLPHRWKFHNAHLSILNISKVQLNN